MNTTAEQHWKARCSCVGIALIYPTPDGIDSPTTLQYLREYPAWTTVAPLWQN